MNPSREIALDHWPRRSIYEFYRKFDAPCFNITVSVEAGKIYAFAKMKQESFFLLCLYAILRAANAVPQVRQRIVDGHPVEYSRIAGMTPIMTEKEMFQQIWCEYAPNYAAFRETAMPLIEAARKGEPMPLENHGQDFLCASCLPWLHFDSITQADYEFQQSVPILAWGKLENGKIPISVKFNHCFMDGLFVARFFEQIEHGFAMPESLERDFLPVSSPVPR
ncbi:MAG: CatA-like O-acetyltransferase [Victivallaceae bacterium]|nr:CatA-like O-acetyltransferase [Victivallaceae bacterium]